MSINLDRIEKDLKECYAKLTTRLEEDNYSNEFLKALDVTLHVSTDTEKSTQEKLDIMLAKYLELAVKLS